MAEVIEKSERVGFEDLARWASDDSHLLGRAALDAVRKVVDQSSAKLRIIAIAMARQQILQIQRVAKQMDQVESVLFDKSRIANMKNDQLIKLYDVLSSRQDGLVGSFTSTVLDPKTQFDVDQSAVNKAFEADYEEKSVQMTPELRTAVVEKLTTLSDQISGKRSGLVTPPPVIS